MSDPLTIRFATDVGAAKAGMVDLATSVVTNMGKVPENGSAPMASRTRAASPSTPLRKSTGRVATITLTAPLGPIMTAASGPGSPP